MRRCARPFDKFVHSSSTPQSLALRSRIVAAAKLQPHRIRTFTFSPDPDFEAKLLDIVGLYLNPPENALVLCVDEKTGIQALNRTQPGLPLRTKKPGCATAN